MSLIVSKNVSKKALLSGMLYKPVKTSWTSRFESTKRIYKENCSSADISVVESAIIEKYSDSFIHLMNSCCTCNDIIHLYII